MFQVVFGTVYTFVDILKVPGIFCSLMVFLACKTLKLLVKMSKNLFKMGIFTKILRNVSFCA